MHIQQILALMAHQELTLIHHWIRGVYSLGGGRPDFHASRGLGVSLIVGTSLVSAMVESGLIERAGMERPFDNEEYLLTAEGRRRGRAKLP
jgi:hypothetical protein